MAIDRQALTPQQRLALSRRALFRQPAAHIPDDLDAPMAHAATRIGAHEAADGPVLGWLNALPWIGLARRIGGRWWRRHPANAVCQLARPVLQRYAEEQPTRLLAAAAGAGALVVLIKPWRLLSVSALLALVLKSSDVADMVTTLMARNETSPEDKH